MFHLVEHDIEQHFASVPVSLVVELDNIRLIRLPFSASF